MTKANTLVIERSNSPWEGYTGSAEEEQAGFHVEARDKLDGLEVPATPKSDQYGGKPLLAIDRAARKVVVNAAVFGKLYRPDATRLHAGESAVVGILRTPAAFANMGALADFLLRAQIIRTYAHLGAELKKIAEKDTATHYRADFSGTHEYYTSKRHVVPFSFAITVDHASGEIKVVGTPAPRAALDIDAIHVMRNGQPSSLYVAMRHYDLDTQCAEDAWTAVDYLRQDGCTDFRLVKGLPDWARDAQGGGLQICQDVGNELAKGMAPDAAPLIADNLADGSLYIADAFGKRILTNERAAALFRDALHWNAEPYEDLLPEFAQQISDYLKKHA